MAAHSIPVFRHLRILHDNLLANFIFLLILIIILKGWPVPEGNEFLYLLLPVKQWDPSFLLNDWTLSSPWNTHLIFNSIIAPFTSVFSVVAIGWAGRIVCWSLILLALFELGKEFGIPLWTITVSVILWILQDQAIVGGEWVIGGFEAKCVAYVFLLFSLKGFIRGRDTLPSILLGLAFSFHPAVGFWGGLAVGLSLVFLQYPLKTLLKFVCYSILFGLPGLIPLLPVLAGSASSSPEDWRYVVHFRSPFHLDPFSWPKRDVLLVYILLLFNVLHFQSNKANPTLRFLMVFESCLGFFFSVGLLFRFAENYELLKFGPFRLFPVFVLLLFFFHLMHAYHYRLSIKLRTRVVGVGFLALLGIGNPLGQFVDMAVYNYILWTQESDIQKAYKWVAHNTPIDSIVISPPWRNDSWYLSQRAQIVNWRQPPNDRFGEWRERLEAMVGHSWAKLPEKTWTQEMEQHFNQLTEANIKAIIKSYSGDYLVSKGNYSFPALFDSGTYKVFSLKELYTYQGRSQ